MPCKPTFPHFQEIRVFAPPPTIINSRFRQHLDKNLDLCLHHRDRLVQEANNTYYGKFTHMFHSFLSQDIYNNVIKDISKQCYGYANYGIENFLTCLSDCFRASSGSNKLGCG